MAAQAVLPDFELISRSHADLSRELGRCGNLPALPEGNLVLQAIREMREEMREIRGDMREMRGEMREIREDIRQTKNLIAIRSEMKQRPETIPS